MIPGSSPSSTQTPIEDRPCRLDVGGDSRALQGRDARAALAHLGHQHGAYRSIDGDDMVLQALDRFKKVLETHLIMRHQVETILLFRSHKLVPLSLHVLRTRFDLGKIVTTHERQWRRPRLRSRCAFLRHCEQGGTAIYPASRRSPELTRLRECRPRRCHNYRRTLPEKGRR